MSRLAALCLVVTVATSCQTSISNRKVMFGGEAQVYPTGVFLGPRGELELGARDALHARAAVHFADRGDAGEHDSEEGEGYGGGIGWRHWFNDDGEGFAGGARLDLWRLHLSWRDDAPLRTGDTSVTVLVPSVEAAHSWRLDGGGRFDVTLGLGYEMNLDTDGEDVGQGAILMLGVSFSGGTRGVRRLHERPYNRPEPEPRSSRDVVSMISVR